MEKIEEAYQTFIPLCPDIKTAIRIVPASEMTCKRGQQFCILLYSETKDNYFRNIGYLGEQLDLYLASQSIGALWFGIGRPEAPSFGGLDFVIMIAISKVDDEKKFRKDMFKSKRKPKEEIWVETKFRALRISFGLLRVLVIHNRGLLNIRTIFLWFIDLKNKEIIYA